MEKKVSIILSHKELQQMHAVLLNQPKSKAGLALAKVQVAMASMKALGK